MRDEHGSPKMLDHGPHELRDEQVRLAAIYMNDGAFRTAANIFRRLADDIDEHIDAVEIEQFGHSQRTDGWGVAMIRDERKRQIAKEGWTPEHDDEHGDGSMALAAAAYAAHDRHPAGRLWPWSTECWKPRGKIDNLTRAGALIAAEIDRLVRSRRGDADG